MHAASEALILHSQVLWLIPLFPLVGFLIAVCAENAPGVVKITSPLAVLLSFVVALSSVVTVAGAPEGARLAQTLYTWIAAGPFHADIAFRVDALSAVMVLIVTGVGFLIHVYSVGYMGHDESCCALLRVPEPLHVRDAAARARRQPARALRRLGRRRALLLSAIGFWYDKDENAAAGKKAFIVNRIGDLGFVLGLFLLDLEPRAARRTVSSSLDFAHIEAHAHALGARDRDRDRAAAASSAPPASRRRSRSTSGSPTRWPARRRSRR